MLVLQAHGVHASLTQIDYQSSTHTLEITMVVVADDVENHLRRTTGRQIELDRTEDAERLVFAYLKKHFELRTRDDRPIELKWVGMEVAASRLTAYLEAEAGEADGMRVRQDVLFEDLPDQTNILSVKRDRQGRSSDHLFTPGSGWQTVRLPPAGK
jgi:phosphoribosylamine-glycine ligase